MDSSLGEWGGYTSIALDSNDKIHISYYDDANEDLKYATNATKTWQTFTIDSEQDVGQYASIAIDSNDFVHISYYDCGEYDAKSSCTIGDLKYATNATGDWQTFIIDSEQDVGWYTSIAIDSNDKVHISYYDCGDFGGLYCSKGDLKYATNKTGEWQTFTIDTEGETGMFTSIAIDSKNMVHISYQGSYSELRYATNAEE